MAFRWFFAAALLLVAQSAWADQQEYVSKADAERALAIVKNAKVVRTFCAPCNDKVSALLNAHAARISEVPPGPGGDSSVYWLVSIDHQSLDLAYTYVPVQSGFWFWRKEKWQNLARMMSLPVSDVPEFLSEAQLGASGSK
jgi:hypothetical protein